MATSSSAAQFLVGFEIERELISAPGEPTQPGIGERRHGVDLKDSSNGHDLEVNSRTMNISTVSGLAAFLQRFEHALATVPGDMWWNPDWGIGIHEFANAKTSATNLTLLKNRVRDFALRDPAVTKVDPLSVTVSGDGLVILTAGIAIDGGDPTVLSYKIRPN